MSKKDLSNKFNFFVPATFEKGMTDGGATEMLVKGVCSTTAQDTDGETLLPEGFDYAPFLQKGFINWNHQGGKTSSAIIGRPTKAEVINGGQDFYIEGFLYKGSAEARSVYDLAAILENEDPDRRLGWSIEGQAIEKDPINPKIIRRARITGVAITASPKNPNTLLSLIKGDYLEPFVEDETDEDEDDTTKEKSMTAEGGDRVTSIESVDGKTHLITEEMKKIEKSEIFSQIIDKYDTYDEAVIERIYSVIEKANNMSAEISQEVINKSFEILDQAAGLVKSEGSEKKEDVIEKSEEEKADDLAKSEMEKAISFAKENLEKGMSENANIEDLIRKGCALTVSQTAVQTAISEYQAVGEGGQIQTLKSQEDELNKSEEETLSKAQEIDLIKGMIAEQFAAFVIPETKVDLNGVQDLIKSEVSSIGTSFTGHFSSLGNLLKGQFDQNAVLLQKIEKLEKSNQEFALRVEEMDNQPVRPRSVTSQVQVVDRFQKSQPQNGFDAANTYNVGDKAQREQLSTRLFDEFILIKGAGREDRLLEKAIKDLESSGSVLEDTAGRIKQLGINVVKY